MFEQHDFDYAAADWRISKQATLPEVPAAKETADALLRAKIDAAAGKITWGAIMGCVQSFSALLNSKSAVDSDDWRKITKALDSIPR